MALLLRLRRAAALSSSLLKDCSFSSSINSYSSHLPLSNSCCPTVSPLGNPSLRVPSQTQSSSFHSSIPCSVGRFDRDQGSKIPEDEILFEGCDYNHWLITMDFPKDPKPSPEEMVETYVQTLAKVVGSVEEAKKRMYACSTTTYQGFQAVMTEETSEKFRGLPGVVFILPDSYIDPVNKQYGGDKYDNGVITPRPPPIQYGRQGRYGDRNRRYDQPRYERQSSPSPLQGRDPNMHQGNPNEGYGRNFTPQQNYGPPGQDARNYGPRGDMQQGLPPMQQANPGMQQDNPHMQQGYGRNYGPPQNYGPPGQDGRSYGPPGQDGRSYGPPGDVQQGLSPMQQGNPGMQQDHPHMQQGYVRNYGPPGQDGRSYGPPGGVQQGLSPMQQGNPDMQQGNPRMQQGYGRNYGPPGQDGRSYGRPGDTEQGWRQQGNPQMQRGSTQMQPGHQPNSSNGPMQDGGAYAPQPNYGPYGDEGRGQ